MFMTCQSLPRCESAYASRVPSWLTAQFVTATVPSGLKVFGVKHHDRRAVERLLPIEHGLVLQPSIFPEKVPGSGACVARNNVGSSTVW